MVLLQCAHPGRLETVERNQSVWWELYTVGMMQRGKAAVQSRGANAAKKQAENPGCRFSPKRCLLALRLEDFVRRARAKEHLASMHL
eukprot:6180321-Pleurochrysis_carterae.AAC.2